MLLRDTAAPRETPRRSPASLASAREPSRQSTVDSSRTVAQTGRTVPAWFLFLVPALIWGTTWLVIKFQLGTVAPEASVAYRFGLASLVLFAWCAVRRIPLRFDARTHAAIALIGLFQFGIDYVLVYLSEERLTSGLIAVVFALVVFWSLAGARVFFGTRFPMSVLFGATLGVLGVMLVFWPEVARFRGLREHGLGLTFAVLATLGASAGNLWSQRVYGRGVAVVPSTAWGMLYGSAAVALYCVLRGIPFTFDTSLRYVTSLAYLSIFGSVIAFILFLTLVQRIGAARSGYTAVVIPVLAMTSSTVFEGYRWTGLAVAGMGLVLAGSLMVLRGRQRA
jgi:drug/metabolite transporter (DMT)-like permease